MVKTKQNNTIKLNNKNPIANDRCKESESESLLSLY